MDVKIISAGYPDGVAEIDGQQVITRTPSGSSRGIAVVGDLVLKVGHQSNDEAKRWHTATPEQRAWLAPVIASGDDWLLQARVEKPPMTRYADCGSDDDWDADPVWMERATDAADVAHRVGRAFNLCDMSLRQMGWLDGRPVAHDYGV